MKRQRGNHCPSRPAGRPHLRMSKMKRTPFEELDYAVDRQYSIEGEIRTGWGINHGS